MKGEAQNLLILLINYNKKAKQSPIGMDIYVLPGIVFVDPLPTVSILKLRILIPGNTFLKNLESKINFKYDIASTYS